MLYLLIDLYFKRQGPIDWMRIRFVDIEKNILCN